MNKSITITYAVFLKDGSGPYDVYGGSSKKKIGKATNTVASWEAMREHDEQIDEGQVLYWTYDKID